MDPQRVLWRRRRNMRMLTLATLVVSLGLTSACNVSNTKETYTETVAAVRRFSG